MYEVYADKFQAGHNDTTDKDFLVFIERKAQSSDTVAKWSTSNLVNVRNNIKRSICDAGLAKRNDDTLLIQRPIIEDDLRMLFDEADKVYARAMLMEV
jgi:hypothetical protein